MKEISSETEKNATNFSMITNFMTIPHDTDPELSIHAPHSVDMQIFQNYNALRSPTKASFVGVHYVHYYCISTRLLSFADDQHSGNIVSFLMRRVLMTVCDIIAVAYFEANSGQGK